MKFKTKENLVFQIRKLHSDDFDSLLIYLNNLSQQTKSKFGPHEFNFESLINYFKISDDYEGFIALNDECKSIIGYCIIKNGFLEHDKNRLESYQNITLRKETDCTFAPSVADNYQGYGIGNAFFQFIKSYLRSKGKKRIILWGGVQKSNIPAVKFYFKNGFRKLGDFEYYGWNLDMLIEI